MKTKQLALIISKQLSEIEEISKFTKKKAIQKKIKSLAKELKEVIKKKKIIIIKEKAEVWKASNVPTEEN